MSEIKKIPLVLKKKEETLTSSQPNSPSGGPLGGPLPVVVCIKGKKDTWGNGPNDLYIGRAMYMGGWKLPQSKWHNPFKMKDYNNDINQVLGLYRDYFEKNQILINDLHELGGKRLGCWCKVKGHESCHGDILVELYQKYIANPKG